MPDESEPKPTPQIQPGRIIVPTIPGGAIGDSLPKTERGHHVIPMTPLPDPDKSSGNK